MVLRALLAALLLSAIAVPATAKKTAKFIDGRYASATGCKMLRKLDAGTPRSLETVPEVLTREGFKGWEGACEFTKIYGHEKGRTWIALMLCSEGQTIAPQTFMFMKNPEDGSFDVAAAGQEAPDIYVRCDKKQQ